MYKMAAGGAPGTGEDEAGPGAGSEPPSLAAPHARVVAGPPWVSAEPPEGPRPPPAPCRGASTTAAARPGVPAQAQRGYGGEAQRHTWGGKAGNHREIPLWLLKIHAPRYDVLNKMSLVIS